MASRAGASGEPVDPLWYRDAIIYELHVRAFQDSTGDGIGDFAGLTSRLPYLQDLGVTALWLLPFYPSPLKDDGYDISDYTGVHADYGTLDDFRRFLDAAHARGLRVITELVVNHTSDQHAWFQRARQAAKGSPERDFYVWSDTPEQYKGARVIFQDFELSNWTWDPVAHAYYWHRFYSHQPDLNFDNPRVFDAVQEVLDFWFALGVDGMRLDAVPYLVEREGTSSENLAPTHEILKRFRRHVDDRFPNRMFIAEANQWPEDAVAYFGSGDESHMVFHFPLMPRLFMAIRREDRLPIVDILQQTPDPPDGCQWALFLRNHDELTLEMVTEEERLYMYHVYASEPRARINLGIRRRLAPLLDNSRRRIELMNALLFSLPGTPVLYYGDEIGMGDNIYLGDRNGVRTPMQWSADRNGGFSDASPQRLYLPLIIDDAYHYQSVHVEQQSQSRDSLLNWMKRLIRLRRRQQAFGRGDLVFVDCSNPHVLAFVRRWRDEEVLVVANLSRFVQHATLDLHAHAGLTPVELFGATELPPIGEAPYAVMLGPHGFFWCRLAAARDAAPESVGELPQLRLAETFDEALRQPTQSALESLLVPYLERTMRWGRGESRVLDLRIEDALEIATAEAPRHLLVLHVALRAGEPERILLPVACRPAEEVAREEAIAEVCFGDETAPRQVLYDAARDPELARWLVDLAARGGAVKGRAGQLRALAHERAEPSGVAEAIALSRSPNGPNVLVALGEDAVLKIFRRLEPGRNPEIEITRWLTSAGFDGTPRLVGSLHYEVADRGASLDYPIGVLKAFAANDGEAWDHTLAVLERYLDAAERHDRPAPEPGPRIPGFGSREALPADPQLGAYLEFVQRLGRRTADLHRALAANEAPDFAPERFTGFTQRSEYQRMRTTAVEAVEQLRLAEPRLPARLRELARPLIDARASLDAPFSWMLRQRIDAARIRVHGNYHLGQVLLAGDDLVILDFDGEPGRPLYERRLKRAPLHDVAAMVRSFHYAARHALLARDASSDGKRGAHLAGWARTWSDGASAAFVRAYTEAMSGTAILPANPELARRLFRSYVIERAFYELAFELAHASPLLEIPLLDLPLLLDVASTAS